MPVLSSELIDFDIIPLQFEFDAKFLNRVGSKVKVYNSESIITSELRLYSADYDLEKCILIETLPASVYGTLTGYYDSKPSVQVQG